MPLDPDTEIQYRKGGKIMKKMPRKFQSGGQTEAPKTGMELERENVRKDRATQQGLDNYNAERPTMLGPRVPKPTPPKPSEKSPVAKKKGGAVKKYARGGGIEVKGKTKGKIV